MAIPGKGDVANMSVKQVFMIGFIAVIAVGVARALAGKVPALKPVGAFVGKA